MSQPRLKFALLAAAGALALSACDDNRAARIDVPDPTPAAYAPNDLALPYAEPAPVAPAPVDTAYLGPERAYDLQEAFYGEPPAYAFYDEGVEPYVWVADDEREMYAEPWDGGFRYYYYEPGAAYPYFVRDRDYGFSYDAGGVLISVIDASGGYLRPDRFRDVAPLAGRYWARGRELRNASRQARRTAVSAKAWEARAPMARRSAQPFIHAARTEPRWREWRRDGGDRQARRVERRRAAEAARPALRPRHDARAAAFAEEHGRNAAASERDEADHRAHRKDRAAPVAHSQAAVRHARAKPHDRPSAADARRPSGGPHAQAKPHGRAAKPHGHEAQPARAPQQHARPQSHGHGSGRDGAKAAAQARARPQPHTRSESHARRQAHAQSQAHARPQAHGGGRAHGEKGGGAPHQGRGHDRKG
jgi:hypothetical protein